MDYIVYADKLLDTFRKKFKEQYPDTAQGSLLYLAYLEICNNILGKYFLKEGTTEYYSISDADIYISGLNERELLLEDLSNCNNCLAFMNNARNYVSDVNYRNLTIWQQ